jgi:dolichol-phosphate mannosyltransferase
MGDLPKLLRNCIPGDPIVAPILSANPLIQLHRPAGDEPPAPVVSALITVIVPVFNEARTILEVLRRVLVEPTPKEIVIVDDGSTDGTERQLDEWQADWRDQLQTAHVERVVLLRHPVNRGKGAAIRTAIQQATAEFIVVQDADLEVSPDEYPELIQPLIANQADIVIGFRSQAVASSRLVHGAGIRLLNLMVRILYGISIRDEACCFKVLRTRDLLRMKLECHRFEYCPEVVAKAARLGL